MTVGAIPYAVLALVVFGLVLIALGPVVDELIIADNSLMGEDSLPYSQQRLETVQFLMMLWRVLAVAAVLCVTLFLVMNGAQSRSGGV